RLLQGPPLPRRGERDSRAPSRLPRHALPRGRARHAQHGRSRSPPAVDVDAHVGRDARHRRHPALRRILLQGPNPQRRLLPGRRPAGGWLRHGLEPVAAVAARRRPGMEGPHGSEWALVIAAVAAAGLGSIAAVRLLRPEELVPARLAPAERGFARVLWKKWYVDEIYDFLFVRPLIWLSREVLWRTIDLGLIDGAGVNGAARLSRALGWIGSRL